MIQSEARRVLAEFEQRALINYDRCDKQPFAYLLDELEQEFGRHFDGANLQEVRSIRERWQKDRINPALHAGADTIQNLIERTRKLVKYLPAELPLRNDFVDLSHLAEFAQPALQAHAMRKLP